MDELVFMRHGHALGIREAGVPSDSQRPLSPRGEKEALAAAKKLAAAGFAPRLIISSPFLRATRTAELAASVFPQAAREISAALSDGPVQDIMSLAESAPAGSVMLVGHQPLLGMAAGFCLSGASLDFAPAGFARLRRGAPRSQQALLEFYDPAGAEEQAR
jgi:phosphohistidine phosphatase